MSWNAKAPWLLRSFCTLAAALAMSANGSTAFGEPVGCPRMDVHVPLAPILRTYLRDQIGGTDKTTRISVATIRDEKTRSEDIVVYVSGQMWCGSGGCRLLVLTPCGSEFRLIGSTTIVQLPVHYLGTTTHGHADLAVFVAGGGIEPGHYAKLAFDGRSYPPNPSMPPAKPIPTPHGEILFPTTARWQGTLLYR